MSTRNDKRDENMRSMFHEAQSHLIKVEVSGAEESRLRPRDGRPGQMQATLTIAGRRGGVTGAVTNLEEAPGSLAFDLAFPVSLAAFHLEPPSALAGIIKVKDTVDVTAHVSLRKEAR